MCERTKESAGTCGGCLFVREGLLGTAGPSSPDKAAPTAAEISPREVSSATETMLKGRLAMIESLASPSTGKNLGYLPGHYHHSTQRPAAMPQTPDLKQRKYTDSDKLCTFS